MPKIWYKQSENKSVIDNPKSGLNYFEGTNKRSLAGIYPGPDGKRC